MAYAVLMGHAFYESRSSRICKITGIVRQERLQHRDHQVLCVQHESSSSLVRSWKMQHSSFTTTSCQTSLAVQLPFEYYSNKVGLEIRYQALLLIIARNKPGDCQGYRKIYIQAL